MYLVRFHLFRFFSIDSCKAEWLFVLLLLRQHGSRHRGKSYRGGGVASHMYLRVGSHPTTISSAVLPPSHVYRLWSWLFFFSLAVVHPLFDFHRDISLALSLFGKVQVYGIISSCIFHPWALLVCVIETICFLLFELLSTPSLTALNTLQSLLSHSRYCVHAGV